MAKSLVVIGAGQGGLSAAIHARLRGYDVLVLEQHDAAGGKAAAIETHGYRLDPGPSIIILTHLYEAVFRAAGRNPADYLQFDRLDPFTRVFFDGGEPIDLPGDESACIQLLRQLSRSDADNLQMVLHKLERVAPLVDRTVFARPVETWAQFLHPNFLRIGMQFDVRRTYRQLIDGWFELPMLRAFFYGFPSYNGQTYDGSAAGALLIPYYMLRHGVYYPRGGVAAIPAAFRRLAEELGVEFRYGARVTQVRHANQRVTAVQLADGERVTAREFISNVDPYTLPIEGRTPPAVQPNFSYYTWHWGLPGPLPMLRHHTLIIPRDYERGFRELYDDRRFPTEPIVYLNETSALDPSAAPAGRANLFAVVTGPAEHPHLDWAGETRAQA
ncbi:MAG: FAD-dependent oxidoreductase, partial [Fimbriimonadaceae bacterium]|nr:FAD-dependent oxidoreductase [Fimbriimonadaceae bacterium]